MERNQNIVEYANGLKKENDELKKYIKTLEEQISLSDKGKNDEWVHIKIFKEALMEAKAVEKEYHEAINDIKKMKIEYRKKLDEMIKQY